MMTTTMTNQQRAAMQMALEALVMLWEDGLEGTPTLTHDEAITALREALAQPQGEWVDLTPHEVTEQIREGAAGGGWQGFAQRITAKFKEKNTPPVVPQVVTEGNASEVRSTDTGEPVAWQDPNSGEVCRAEWLAKNARECDQDRFYVPLYKTPLSVEANDYVLCEVQQEWYVKGWKDAVEKAAKVCEHYALLKRYDDDPEPSMGYAAEECAAAIRGMK